MSASSTTRRGRRADLALHQQWRDRLLRFEQSGLSVSTFCAQQGLSVASFYSWKRRLRPASSAGSSANPASKPEHAPTEARLLPLQLPATTVSSAVEVVLPSGVVLRLPAGCDLPFVQSLIRSLGELPC